MKKIAVLHLFFVLIMGFGIFSCKETPPYLETKLTFEERADDLLSRLTTEEKAALMRYDLPAMWDSRQMLDIATAIADVIFGDYNPAGRLPVTFYKDVSQIPAFDNYFINE